MIRHYLQKMKVDVFGIRIDAPYFVVCAMCIVILFDTSFNISSCFIAAVIHESGHLLMMSMLKIKPKSIALHLFDIAITDNSAKSDVHDMLITLSGPVLNFVFALVFYNLSFKLFVSNIVIGVFNLLPIETFDGGHALAVFLNKKLKPEKTTLIIKALTFLFLVPFLFFGVMMLFYSKYNYSLLLISLYLLVILFTK